ncbi:MAG: FAD-dependent monooxygenase [Flavobacteriales bacterium]|nr:FAD-dependent monooxygenase [Flavobacteriales bacterium]
MKNTIHIIGAGIAGLTLALVLKKKNIPFAIHESTSDFKKVGAGINLAHNATQIFKRLGIYENLEKLGNPLNGISVRSLRHKSISTLQYHNFNQLFGVQSIGIHRADLHSVLLEALQDQEIGLDRKLQTIAFEGELAVLKFENGESIQAEYVVGADGIHSKVRSSIFPETKTRDFNQSCWRGTLKYSLKQEYKNRLNSFWGPGRRLGFFNYNDEEVYWFATTDKIKEGWDKTGLLDKFSAFPEVAQSLLAETNPNQMIFNQLEDLKPLKNWFKGNVCLVGDAAHGMTPNLGQGACQAIESAYVLGHAIAEEQDVTSAFEKFQKIRFKKANQIVQRSWKVGKFAQTNSKIIGTARNLTSPLIPHFLSEWQMRPILKIDYD